MPVDLALAASLFLAPLVRHLENGRLDQSIELVNIHGVNAIGQSLEFALMAPDCLFVLSALVGMAGVEGLPHPFKHLVVEL